MNTPNSSQASSVPPAVEKEILAAVSSIHYGSVEVVIHNSVVVQIQRTEKVRFDHAVPNSRS
jgi:hypothetical protein